MQTTSQNQPKLGTWILAALSLTFLFIGHLRVHPAH
jgi:hypothetical protein